MSVILLFLRSGGWKIVLGGLLVVAALAALHHYGSTRYAAGKEAAQEVARKQIDKLTSDAADLVQKANKRAKDASDTGAINQAAIDAAYTKGTEDANAAHAVERDDLRTGRKRLSVAVVRACPAAGDRAVPGPAATAGGSDDTATATLAGPVAARLDDRYHDYDNLVRQLAAAQAVILNDRVVCNGR